MKKTLKQARTERGISLKWVADRMGVARQTIAKWESDPSAMTIINAKRYCDLIGVDMQEIFFGKH